MIILGSWRFYCKDSHDGVGISDLNSHEWFHFSEFSLDLAYTENMFQRFQIVFNTFKHLKVVREKYSAVCHSFNYLVDIWKWGETKSPVFLWNYKNIAEHPRRPKYLPEYILYVFSLASYSTKLNIRECLDGLGVWLFSFEEFFFKQIAEIWELQSFY